ncbi:MAG: hypothetical protein FD177_1263 [Desulfovibrionaceae bacterium]|nr:MAG: hypothetical protein FD177_1263 [Desulfovibrionaceae bacterium]
MSRTPLTQPDFLPMTRAEMDRLGWHELDILLVTGDAYVDHPSFGAPLLGRWLVEHGYRVGIVAQPRWDVPDDVAAMGRPRLFAGVTAGALDSMLAHYTAFRKKRSDDAYTPGGKAGNRPNRAGIAYTNIVRRAFPGIPVILGGIEASLRRVSHYDFWSDALRRSVLFDSKATAILYGMADQSIISLADSLDAALEEGGDLRSAMASIPGLAFAGKPDDLPPDADVLELPSHESMLADRTLLVQATKLLERHVHQDRQTATQPSGDRLLILTPPGPGLDGPGLDRLYALPFSRRAHPSYKEAIPATAMIATSLNTHRGCAGGCSFCTLALHQGRRIRSRSRASVLAEAKRMASQKDFTGSVSDVGGPSANMWGGHCAGDTASCARPSCLTPRICKHFKVNQKEFVELLRGVSGLPGVKHVRVASGWRMDLGLADKTALGVMIREFTGGQAKVAPEHRSEHVLRLMRKPSFTLFEEFLRLFSDESQRAGKEQYVVPYLLSAFPGCTVEDMRGLSDWLASKGWKPSQVQCFIPLPGTAAAAMFFAGTDMECKPIHVAATDAERLQQHGILAPSRPETPYGGARRDTRTGRDDARNGRDTRTGRDDARPGRDARTGRDDARIGQGDGRGGRAGDQRQGRRASGSGRGPKGPRK